ncbi:MAG: transcriptional repressor [Acidobacteria bacterium]|nr:transcriptional repressor [Acidobacteriota bacterium]
MTDEARANIDSVEDLHAVVGARFHETDQRYTSGRRRLVELLFTARRPLTQPEIIERDPALPASSIYRNLDALERAGLIARVSPGTEHARYELSESLQGHHHHLVCVDCGHIEDVRLGEALEAIVDRELSGAAADAGFMPLFHNVDLHGRCEVCAR